MPLGVCWAHLQLWTDESWSRCGIFARKGVLRVCGAVVVAMIGVVVVVVGVSLRGHGSIGRIPPTPSVYVNLSPWVATREPQLLLTHFFNPCGLLNIHLPNYVDTILLPLECECRPISTLSTSLDTCSPVEYPIGNLIWTSSWCITVPHYLHTPKALFIRSKTIRVDNLPATHVERRGASRIWQRSA